MLVIAFVSARHVGMKGNATLLQQGAPLTTLIHYCLLCLEIPPPPPPTMCLETKCCTTLMVYQTHVNTNVTLLLLKLLHVLGNWLPEFSLFVAKKKSAH